MRLLAQKIDLRRHSLVTQENAYQLIRFILNQIWYFVCAAGKEFHSYDAMSPTLQASSWLCLAIRLLQNAVSPYCTDYQDIGAL